MPQNFGYIRINPLNIDHLKEFKKIDLDKLFIDQYNSSKPNQELENLLDLIQPEDKLIIESMSCIADNFFELQAFIQHFYNQGISLFFHKEQILISPNKEQNDLTLLQALAKFESDNVIKIKKIKQEKARKKRSKVEYALIRKAMSVEGASYRSVAKQFNVGIATVQRAMKKDI